MPTKKRYLKSRPTCKVTLILPSEQACKASAASVVGDFNNWDPHSNPMDRLKNGNFKTTVELEVGQHYQFRYLLDNGLWLNEVDADQLVDSPYEDAKNSLIVI